MSYKDVIRDYFTLSKFERNAMIILLVIMLIIIVLYYSLPNLVKTSEYDNEKYRKKFEEFKNQLSMINYKPVDSNDADNDEIVSIENEKLYDVSHKPFDFDPNKISAGDWKKLGVSQKIIRRIKNYLAKGGHFYSKEDLKKIYGFDSNLYYQLEKHILIEKKERNEFKKNKVSLNKPLPEAGIININIATEQELMKIPGIDVLAARVIKYRDKLGGFYSKEQLLEVYNFTSERYIKTEKYIEVDQKKVHKITLNLADITTLGKHPYIGFDLAKKILNFRNKNGAFQSIDELKTMGIITDEKQFEKLKNYLELWE